MEVSTSIIRSMGACSISMVQVIEAGALTAIDTTMVTTEATQVQVVTSIQITQDRWIEAMMFGAEVLNVMR